MIFENIKHVKFHYLIINFTFFFIIKDNTTTETQNRKELTKEEEKDIQLSKKMSKLNRSSDSDDSIHFVESSQEVAANIAQSTSPFSLLEDYNQLNSVEPTDETKSPLNIEIQSSSSFVIKLNDSTSKIKSVSTPDEESLDQVDMFLKDYEFLNVSNEYKANENESDTSIIYEKTNDENTLSNVTSAVSSEIIDQQLKQIENITNQSLNKYFDKML